MEKSSVDEIRARFDKDVERFSNLESGQTATVDASLAMSLVAESAAACTPHARALLDVGCGAGNYSLKLLQHLPSLEVTLLDLSKPMLDSAYKRVSAETSGAVHALQADVRDFMLSPESTDIILAAAVLHHLRTEDEWNSVFTKFYRGLRQGGSLWIFDLVESSIPAVGELMQQRYGTYLCSLRDSAYRDYVFDYIKREDSPRSLSFQTDLLREVGFSAVEVLHKNTCFAAFGAVK